jgi:hypothetical protein
MLRTSIAATALAVVASHASAMDLTGQMQAFYDANLADWATDAAIVDAITAQNTEYAGLDGAAITDLDLQWRAEVGGASTPLIDGVLSHPLSDFLRSEVAASGGAITEVFVMDMHGLNVASSGVTSDYWQGDEAKHSETYGAGPGAIHFSEVEFDESSQSYSAQISFSVVDASGAVVGAVTVGVNAESLM